MSLCCLIYMTCGHRRKLAIGLETGEISIYTNDEQTTDWRLRITKSAYNSLFFHKVSNILMIRSVHVDQIHRLAWRARPGNSAELASCSEDGTLKLLDIVVNMN